MTKPYPYNVLDEPKYVGEVRIVDYSPLPSLRFGLCGTNAGYIGVYRYYFRANSHLHWVQMSQDEVEK